MSEIQNAYRRLLARASAAGYIAPGGLTPREAMSPLSAAVAAHIENEPNRVAELTELVEQCAYANGGTDKDRDLALRLCETIGQMIPEPPAHETADRRWNLNWLGALPYVLAIALIAVVSYVFFSSGVSLSFSWTGAGGSSGGSTGSANGSAGIVDHAWQSATQNELASVRHYDGGWQRSSRDCTWMSLQIDTILRSSPDQRGVAPDGPSCFDLDTGTDGVFTNANDPFTPPLGWTHREFIYDRIGPNYQLLRAPRGSASAVGLEIASGQKFDVTVQVRSTIGQPTVIPSPSPDAVITTFEATPTAAALFTRDEGDGLHVLLDRSGMIDLHYTCSANRLAYESRPLPDQPFPPAHISMPGNVRRDAQLVIGAIGDLPQPTFEATVRRLHSYFAGFTVAPTVPEEDRGNDYLTVALARKGVCRHRARSFFITASALGVNTRLVENRCHSFCEVEIPDGTWRRLEFRLGDEEGPPGLTAAHLARGTLPQFNPLTAWLMALLPFGLVLSVALIIWRTHRNSFMQLGMHGRRGDRAAQRADRDDDLHRTNTARSLRLATLAEMNTAGDAPPAIVRRAGNLADVHRETADPFELQRIYWDCVHIVRWLNRRERR